MPPLPTKKDVALALLEKGSIFVHLDPRRDKVVVPKAFWVQSELVLQFGTQMRVPVPDLDLDDECISGTLSFARRPFWVRIPWHAVFAIVGEDRRGMVWNQDAPKEGASSLGQEKPPEAKRSHLRAVPSPSDAAPPAPPAAEAPTIAASSADACPFCATQWGEDATSCAVCGNPRAAAESDGDGAAPAPAAGDTASEPSDTSPRAPSSDAAEPKSEAPSDAPPPDAPPPKRPFLRLVK